jgi:hypothetical protein
LQNVGARLDYRNGICRSFPEPLQIDGAFKNSDEILILSKEYYKVQTNYAFAIVFLHCLGVRLFTYMLQYSYQSYPIIISFNFNSKPTVQMKSAQNMCY